MVLVKVLHVGAKSYLKAAQLVAHPLTTAIKLRKP